MPNKEFLENFPLFKRLNTKQPERFHQFPKPPINMFCRKCNSEQTFNMTNEFYEHTHEDYPAKDTKVRLEYLCQFCREFTREFYLYISPNLDYIYKVGQYPEWEIKIDKNLKKALGKHAKTYRKGLVCESQGYGIGAFAYYRRITEEIIDELLDSIYDLIEAKEKIQYKDALQKTKQIRVTQEKIDLVKDLLPTILQPNGMNPLGVLHSKLSEGLHAETDDACLEIAGHIREILIFLVNQIIQSKESSKKFTESMKAILDKKSKQES